MSIAVYCQTSVQQLTEMNYIIIKHAFKRITKLSFKNMTIVNSCFFNFSYDCLLTDNWTKLTKRIIKYSIVFHYFEIFSTDVGKKLSTPEQWCVSNVMLVRWKFWWYVKCIKIMTPSASLFFFAKKQNAIPVIEIWKQRFTRIHLGYWISPVSKLIEISPWDSDPLALEWC